MRGMARAVLAVATSAAAPFPERGRVDSSAFATFANAWIEGDARAVAASYARTPTSCGQARRWSWERRDRGVLCADVRWTLKGVRRQPSRTRSLVHLRWLWSTVVYPRSRRADVPPAGFGHSAREAQWALASVRPAVQNALVRIVRQNELRQDYYVLGKACSNGFSREGGRFEDDYYLSGVPSCVPNPSCRPVHRAERKRISERYGVGSRSVTGGAMSHDHALASNDYGRLGSMARRMRNSLCHVCC